MSKRNRWKTAAIKQILIYFLFSGSIQEHMDIYLVNVKRSNYIGKCFLIVAEITILFYITSPAVEIITSNLFPTTANGSNSRDKRTLPLNSWFPFDKSEHFYLAYALNALTVIYGGNYTACVDVFFFALMIFSMGQLKILHAKLEKFKDTAVASMKTKKATAEDKEIAILQTLGECVQQHKKICNTVCTRN